MTDVDETTHEAEQTERAQAEVIELEKAAAAAPTPARSQHPDLTIRGDQITLDPSVGQGPAGPYPLVVLGIRNATAGAVVGMSIAELDIHVARCAELRASITGEGVPGAIIAPNAGRIALPPGVKV